MDTAEIIALVIGLAMIAGRGFAFLNPKSQKELWKKTGERPDCSIREMGTLLIIFGVFLIIFAMESADISAVVMAAAAGWVILLGSYAFAVKPLKSALSSFPKVRKSILQASNILVVAAGALIVYLVLR